MLLRTKLYFLSRSFFHTSSVLRVRGRNHLPNEPNILSEDHPHVKELMKEEEIDSDDEIDYMMADKAYETHENELKQRKVKRERAMTIQKFFRAPKPPLMLTWGEKQQIKYLHSKDPEEWTVEELAKSFPATPEVISKVLKANYQMNQELIKKKDEIVFKNWQLLRDNKLKAEPKLIQHLKKFSDRREERLSLQGEHLEKYLTESKQEPQWNNGQMSKIIENYEKSINKLKQLTDGAKQEKLGLIEEKSFIKEKIQTALESKPERKEQESFFIKDQDGKLNGKHMTLSNLEDELLNMVNEGIEVSKLEKPIINEKLEGTLKQTSEFHEESQSNPRKLRNFKNKNRATNSSYEINDFLQKEDNKKHYKFSDSQKDLENSISKAKYDYRNEKDEIYFKNEESEMSNTYFWGNQTKLVNSSGIDLKESNLKHIHYYPDRIKIPKNKQGKGLTFKVNDCYYDDDGEFMYRVPGMKN